MIAPLSEQLFIGLRAFVLSLLPDIEVIQGLGNGVPTPEGEFVCLTAGAQKRLRTNVATYTVPPSGTGEKHIEQGTQYSIQVDVYGPNAGDQATTLSTAFLDSYACDLLAPYSCQPLYAEDPTQSVLINGEENYEQRWMFNAVLQFNPVVTVPQEFAEEAVVELVNAYTTYPVN